MTTRPGASTSAGAAAGRSSGATGPDRLTTWARISLAGDLTDLSVPPPSLRHQLIPYGLAQFQDGRSPDASAGLDFRYGLTPQTSAYATLNPDFATIEADQEEINLTRFELQLPEKRQFFLEGQEQFNQRITTFYSRRIGDVMGGGKLLGKQGGWAFAALAATGDLSEPDDPPPDPGRATYAVTRVQRDVASRSNIGFLFANRTLGGVNQGSAGLDASLFFTDTFGFTGQLVQSYGEHDRGTMAFFARPSYDSATAHAHVRYTHLGDRFADNVNVIGFVQDDDRRELDGAVEKTFWPRSGPTERVQYSSNYNGYWGQTKILRSWEVDQGVSVDWRNKWTTSVDYTEEFKRFEKDFRNRETELELGYNTRAYQSVTGGLAFGRNFDADFRLWSAAGNWKVTEQLSAEYELQRLTLDPDPEDESTWIHVIRAGQFFTKDLLVRVFFQTNSAIDRRNIQAVFVYRYLPPFGSIQVAYQRGTAEFGQRSDQGQHALSQADHRAVTTADSQRSSNSVQRASASSSLWLTGSSMSSGGGTMWFVIAYTVAGGTTSSPETHSDQRGAPHPVREVDRVEVRERSHHRRLLRRMRHEVVVDLLSRAGLDQRATARHPAEGRHRGRHVVGTRGQRLRHQRQTAPKTPAVKRQPPVVRVRRLTVQAQGHLDGTDVVADGSPEDAGPGIGEPRQDIAVPVHRTIGTREPIAPNVEAEHVDALQHMT